MSIAMSFRPETVDVSGVGLGTDDQASFADCGGRRERPPVGETPDFLPFVEADAVHIAVVRSHEHAIADNYGRAVDVRFGAEDPDLRAREAIETIQLLVLRSDDHVLVVDGGRGMIWGLAGVRPD